MREESVPQTPGLQVLHRADSPAQVVLQFLRHFSTTPLSLKALSKINKTSGKHLFSSEKTAVHTRAEAALWDLHRAHDELQARDEPAQDPPEKVKPMTWERPEAQMWRRVVANAADHWQFRRETCKDPRRRLTKRGYFRDFRTATCLMNISLSIVRCTHRHSCLQSFCLDQV